MPGFKRVPVAHDFASKSSCYRSEVASPHNRKCRLLGVVAIALLWTSGLVWRLYSIQISDVERWQDWALKQHFTQIQLASERGPVYDRNGKLMAVSVPAGSIYVRPGQVKDKPLAIRQIAHELNMPIPVIERKFEEKSPFVWIKRQIPRAFAEKVAALNLQGVGYVVESRRFYPYNEAASALIGKVGVDGAGLSGIESLYERELHGEHITTMVTRDALGNFIQVSADKREDFELPKGRSLSLTLDAALQMITDEELEAGRREANAKSAIAVMMNADTGEILAMSQAPALNFNMAKVNGKSDLKNLSIETVFEPGSIMKPIVAAAAIDAGVVTPTDLIDCENGRFLFSKHTIKDTHPASVISVHDIVVRSSNVGMSKIGIKFGKERLYNALIQFGFGKSLGLGLSGETRGILRNVKDWAQIDVATHSFGQGVAVTPIQILRAMSAIANGGHLPEVRIVSDESEPVGERVISEDTAREVREMLYGVVEEEHGTGHKAAIQGVRIGGKTGTAQKARADGRGYAPGSYVASFVGFADAKAIGLNTKLSLIVILDEPRTNSIYGGILAAPIFQRIMERSMKFLSTQKELNSGIEPHDSVQMPRVDMLRKVSQIL